MFLAATQASDVIHKSLAICFLDHVTYRAENAKTKTNTKKCASVEPTVGTIGYVKTVLLQSMCQYTYVCDSFRI